MFLGRRALVLTFKWRACTMCWSTKWNWPSNSASKNKDHKQDKYNRHKDTHTDHYAVLQDKNELEIHLKCQSFISTFDKGLKQKLTLLILVSLCKDAFSCWRFLLILNVVLDAGDWKNLVKLSASLDFWVLFISIDFPTNHSIQNLIIR